jgi:hypothetical protein
MANPLNSRQADLTNYYIYIGTLGGLPAMLLLIAILWVCFTWVGRVVRSNFAISESKLMAWCLGAALFAHAATSISVAYFDQSKTFLWLNIAMISSMFTVFENAGKPSSRVKMLAMAAQHTSGNGDKQYQYYRALVDTGQATRAIGSLRKLGRDGAVFESYGGAQQLPTELAKDGSY